MKKSPRITDKMLEEMEVVIQAAKDQYNRDQIHERSGCKCSCDSEKDDCSECKLH